MLYARTMSATDNLLNIRSADRGRREGGRAGAGVGKADRGVEDFRSAGDAAGDRRRAAGIRRKPGAGGQGQVAAALLRNRGDRVAPDRARLQSNKAAEAVALFDAIHTIESGQDRRRGGGRDAEAGADAQAAGAGEYGGGAAKGRRRAIGGRCVRGSVPRGAWARDRRADVHPAGRRRCGTPHFALLRRSRGGWGWPRCRWG